MDSNVLDVAYATYTFLSSLLLLFPILFILLTRRNARLPPGPFAWPIIGNLFDQNWLKAHNSLAKLAQSYGPLMSLRFGSRLVIVASSPEAAREILRTHDRELCGRYTSKVADILPQIGTSTLALATECHQSWRFLRGAVHAELFSAKALKSHSPIRQGKAKEMLEFLGTKDGQEVNIGDILFATSANIVSNALVSQDIIESWKNIEKVRWSTRKLVEVVIPGLVDLYPVIDDLDFWSKKQAVGYCEIMRAIWEDIVSQRRGGRQDSEYPNLDFLDVLIGSSFDDNQIYNLLTELLASSDSVSSVLAWSIAELARNKEAFFKLRDEIMTKDAEGAALSEKHLTKLPYLQACINETIRLHPPGPFLVPRRALQACEVMNYQVPKGALLIVNAHAVGRDQRSWEDPQSFKPERFLRRNLDVRGTNYDFLPFGGGRRICAGYPLALVEIQLLLASLVYAFDWYLPPEMDLTNLDSSKKMNGLTLQTEKPLILIPKTRNEVHKDWA